MIQKITLYLTLVYLIHSVNVSCAPLAAEEIDEELAEAHEIYVRNHTEPSNDTGSAVRTELDILTTRADFEEIIENGTKRRRNAVISSNYMWPNGVVNYMLDEDLFTEEEIEMIEEAMEEWELKTCITFVDVADEEVDKIEFIVGDGCYSWIGRTGQGSQVVSLGDGCFKHKIILHELGHSIGFLHEQSRPDRDNYITIHLENVEEGTEYNFKKYTWDVMRNYSVAYDYKSIMHYGKKAFSDNGLVTIDANDAAYTDEIGRQQQLSFGDVKMTNLMYKCASHCDPLRKCPKEGFRDKHCRCRCQSSSQIVSCRSLTTATTT